jgi:aminoglycoside 3-N-acetyltransferase
MKEVTKQQVIEALNAVGVQPGDGLLVHSALQFLGRPVGGVEMYFEALCEAIYIELGVRNYELGIGPKDAPPLTPNSQLPTGTLAVPTFTFAFARGEPYDPQATPSVGMGMLSEYVRQQPSTLRTPHPMQSLAVIGAYAADLAGRDTPSAFDPGSSFERMLELGFKILLLGADIDAISMIHYSEQRYNVPYRYWKAFTGQVRTPRKSTSATGWQERTYRMYARDLELDPHLTLHSVRDYLQAQGQYYSTPLNYGQVALIHMTDFVQAVDHFLAADPYSLMIPD